MIHTTRQLGDIDVGWEMTQDKNLTRCQNLKNMFSAREIKYMSADQRKQLNNTYTGNIQTTQQRKMEDYFQNNPETSNIERMPTPITKRLKLTQLILINTFGPHQ